MQYINSLNGVIRFEFHLDMILENQTNATFSLSRKDFPEKSVLLNCYNNISLVKNAITYLRINIMPISILHFPLKETFSIFLTANYTIDRQTMSVIVCLHFVYCCPQQLRVMMNYLCNNALPTHNINKECSSSNNMKNDNNDNK